MKEGMPSERFPAGLHNERAQYPTIELQNTVVWKNENIAAPFAFEVGSPSPLGLTFDLSSTDPEHGAGLALRTRENAHGRSADIGAVYFKDPEGRLYRDVDIKGVGAVKAGPGTPAPWRYEVRPLVRNRRLQLEDHVVGLMDKEDALHDSEIAEEFTKLGIRTHRTLAVAELKELGIVDHTSNQMETKSVESLRKAGMIPETFVPVVQIRAFGTKTRIDDIRRSGDMRPEISDTIALLRQETSGEVTDVASYASWFAETFALNIARMHKNGYMHGYLTPHNITLDCRLTDFDSVTKRPEGDADPEIPTYSSWEEEEKAPLPPSEFWDMVSEDFHLAVQTMRMLRRILEVNFPDEESSLDEEVLTTAMEKAYMKEYPEALIHLRWE